MQSIRCGLVRVVKMLTLTVGIMVVTVNKVWPRKSCQDADSNCGDNGCNSDAYRMPGVDSIRTFCSKVSSWVMAWCAYLDSRGWRWTSLKTKLPTHDCLAACTFVYRTTFTAIAGRSVSVSTIARQKATDAHNYSHWDPMITTRAWYCMSLDQLINSWP